MHIVLLCATNRGYRFAETLFDIGQGHRFTVFSFQETPWEPRYFAETNRLVLEHGHEFKEARYVGQAKWDGFWANGAVDLILMVSWRYLVPASVFQRARLGAYVFHDSLLPKYRGFAPTVWAIRNGEKELGVTLFEAVEDVDAGDIVDQRPVAIGDCDFVADVLKRVTSAYLDIVRDNFSSLLSGNFEKRPQNHEEATYTCKWTPEDGLIDWNDTSRAVFDLIRATSQPYPGAFTYLNNRKLMIWSAELPASPRQYVSSAPGRVVEIRHNVGSLVLTGEGCILLKTVQFEGEPVINASEALNSLSQTLG
ncbi:MAG: methionyl-tRNA formyltransferase [Chloroflexi bacterium]|nr:methionyl-tRNA formyltransferase [Chloroflexota bacterium]